MTKTFETIQDTEMGSGRITPAGTRFREFIPGQDDALVAGNWALALVLAMKDPHSTVVVGDDGSAYGFSTDELREVAQAREFTPTTSADLILTEPAEFGSFTLPEGTLLQEVPAAELTAGQRLVLALGSDLDPVAVRALNGPDASRGKTLIIERAKTTACN